MPLRRTKRSNGRQRSRWKDGSHGFVENTHANDSRCNEIGLARNLQTEPLVDVPRLLAGNHEPEVSTRDRPARTGADARIKESAAIGEVRLALRPYGRTNKAPLRMSDNVNYVNYPRGEGLAPQSAGISSGRGDAETPAGDRSAFVAAARRTGRATRRARGSRCEESRFVGSMRRRLGAVRSRARAPAARARPVPVVGRGRKDPGNRGWRVLSRVTRSPRAVAFYLHSEDTRGRRRRTRAGEAAPTGAFEGARRSRCEGRWRRSDWVRCSLLCQSAARHCAIR